MADYILLYKYDKTVYKSVPLYFQRPKIVAYMEVNGTVINTDCNIKYFQTPEQSNYPINLNVGFENYKFHDREYYSSKKLDKIEKYIMTLEEQDACQLPLLVRVYTQRSVLRDLMMSIYLREKLTLYVTKYKDRIFITKSTDETQYNERKNPSDTYHFKFAQHCFTDHPNKVPFTAKPLDESYQNYAIFQSRLRQFQLVYSSEVQGIDAQTVVTDCKNTTELNKYRLVMSKVVNDNYPWQIRIKAIHFWCQAHLSNVGVICLARKDQNGIVHKPAELVNVRDIPKNQSRWSPTTINGFVHRFLCWMYDEIFNIDCPKTVYEFTVNGESKEIHYKVHKDQPFLSPQLIEFLSTERQCTI